MEWESLRLPYCRWRQWKLSGPWFSIKISSYQYRKSHCGDKTIIRSSYLHNRIFYPGKMASLYWISPKVAHFQCLQGTPSLTWSNYNPGMYKESNVKQSVGQNYLSFPKLKICSSHWSLEWVDNFIPHLYWACDYLSILGLKLTKGGPSDDKLVPMTTFLFQCLNLHG